MASIEEFYQSKREHDDPETEVEKKPKKPRKKAKKEDGRGASLAKALGGSVVLILILGSVFTALYFRNQYQKATQGKNEIVGDEVKSITGSISKFIDLPNETPTIATVTDKEKLKGQIFFSNSQNGDKVLIFSESKKAILYRPETGKVIEVTSIVGDKKDDLDNSDSAKNEQVSENSSPENKEEKPALTEETKKYTVSIYNGTNIKGLAADIAKNFSDMSEVEVTKKTNAKGNFTENMVVDISGGNSAEAQKIADKIGGKVVELPEGEKKPEADILVIGGKK